MFRNDDQVKGENNKPGWSDLNSKNDWEKWVDTSLEKIVFNDLGLSSLSKFGNNEDCYLADKYTIIFIDFNIGSNGYENKNISQTQAARGRRFSLKVLYGHDKRPLKGIRIDRDMIRDTGGAYSLFLEYIVTNGVYVDGFYYLGQMNIDVVFSLAADLEEVMYGYPPERLEITGGLYKPEIRITSKADGDTTLSFEEDMVIIPGKYSTFILKDSKVMKLHDMIPWSFISKMETKPSIGPEFRGKLMEDVVPVLKNAFQIKKLKERPAVNAHDTENENPEIKIINEDVEPEVNIYIKKQDDNIYLLPEIKYGDFIGINPFDEAEIQRFATFFHTASKMNILQSVRKDGAIIQFNRDIFKEYEVYAYFDNTQYLTPDEYGRLPVVGDEALYVLFSELIPQFPQDWKVLYDKDIEKPVYKKENVYFDFDFSADTDNGLFEFDLELHCGNLKISIEELYDYINNNTRFLRIDDNFVEITNKEHMDKLFSLLKNFSSKGKNKKYSGRLYHAFELDEFIENSDYYSYKSNENYEKLIQEGKNNQLLEKVRIPQRFVDILRNYQIEGIQWMFFLRKYGFGGILADDMGLGKTLQILALLSMVSEEGTSLIVCPKTLIHNWYNEIEKFAPGLKVLIACGGSEERIVKIKDSEKYNIVITSYPLIQKDIEEYKKIMFEYCVIDEAQYIKNPSTRTARSVKAVRSKYRLALTGTPLENTIYDLWSIFDFVMPGFLGSEHSFKAMFGNTNQDLNSEESKGMLKSLGKKIRPFLLRRTKKEMLKDLPPKIEQISWSELKAGQLALYAKMLEKIRGHIYDTVAAKGFGNSQIEILAGLTRLRQICNHPGLVSEKFLGIEKVSGKLELFEELLDECIDGGHKVLVFSQFVKMLDIIGRRLDMKNIPYCRLDGQSRNRAEIIDTFNNDDTIKVFLISLKAGGFGLNLTSADTVILYDPWWNPMAEDQASDRAHRIGQNNTVNVYRLITKGTVEEKIQKLQERKRMLFDSVVGESRDIFKKLTWEELKDILE